jgi:mono/diheme cytochrome c family protein
MKDRWWFVFAVVIAVVIVVGVSLLAKVRIGAGQPAAGGVLTEPKPTSFRSNGARIYWTGVDDQGKRAALSGGPSWVTMRGGSCVDCHGPDGRGGKQCMMGTAIPPDIRYGVLTGKIHEPGGEVMDHPPYTDATIKRAIGQGLDPGNGKLDLTMPRWRMSERDLNDLVAYLKELDTKKG